MRVEEVKVRRFVEIPQFLLQSTHTIQTQL